MRLERILVASENPGKARELHEIFSALFPGVAVLRPSELGLTIAYPEEGGDYVENAKAKARAAADQSGFPAVADDSGLEVEALGWEPGPRSARYAPTEKERNAKLVAALAGFPRPGERRARYRCAAVLCLPGGETFHADAWWWGRILEAPRGEGGFGYDPLFWDDEAGMTAAEMPAEEKARRSHRGQALRALAGMVRG